MSTILELEGKLARARARNVKLVRELKASRLIIQQSSLYYDRLVSLCDEQIKWQHRVIDAVAYGQPMLQVWIKAKLRDITVRKSK